MAVDVTVGRIAESDERNGIIQGGRVSIPIENRGRQYVYAGQDGKGAPRVQVKLGRSSVTTIEVEEGLRVEDAKGRDSYQLREREAPGSV
jgi:hypothetical protein